jgi:hypothetical protein
MTIMNEELVQKSIITANQLAAAGKLTDAQSSRFIDYVVDESVLKNNARVVRFRNENLDIDKIGVGTRVAVPKAEAADPGRRRGVTHTKISLTPREIMIPWEIGDTYREHNIEGDSVEDHIIRMMATQGANDLEDGYINGNTLGPAILESDYFEGGSSTGYVRDNYLALWTGWSERAESGNVVDMGATNVGLSVFGRMVRALPTKFRRNKSNLRWFISPDLWQVYLEKLSTRATALGDGVAGGDGHAPFGIPAVPVPLWDFTPQVTEHVTLTGTTAVALKNSNIVVGSEAVLPSTLANTATVPFTEGTGNDYVMDYAAGTIARDAAGVIGDGDTVKVTYQAPPQIILTHMNNFIVGIGRDIRIEKDRDIYKGVNQYAITMKADVQFEELTALVKGKNIGLGV